MRGLLSSPAVCSRRRGDWQDRFDETLHRFIRNQHFSAI
jgi:hypothetical protein